MDDADREVVFAAEETLNRRKRVTSNPNDFDSDRDLDEEDEEHYERGSRLKRILNFFTE